MAKTKWTNAKPASRSAFSKALASQKATGAKPKKQRALGKQLPHVIVKAGAGSGKTATLVGAVNRLLGRDAEIVPSEQQAAIWEAVVGDGIFDGEIVFCAFNKAIATTLQQRLPEGAQAMTLHSLGFSIVKKYPGCKFPKVNSWKTANILERVTGVPYREMRKHKIPDAAIKEVVSLCKQNLVMPDAEDFEQQAMGLIQHYGVETNEPEKVINYARDVLEESRSFTTKPGKSFQYMEEIDFDDMIWLPIALDMPVDKVDLLLVDEAQDLNRCQQALALKVGERIVMVGDENQAIYGFAGADAESMNRMQSYLEATDRGVQTFPLNVTRRCGAMIVQEAQRIVPEFYGMEENGEGAVRNIKDVELLASVQEDDMVLCRTNAPLVSTCFKLLKGGRKARIQGRDIGDGLVKLIEKFKAPDIPGLISALEEWHNKETAKLLAKKFPSESAIIALDDKHDCLLAFTENSNTVQDLINTIQRIFSDTGNGVLLSSIHRAKGLEAQTVFVLKPEQLPHPMARSEWQRQQEMNLKYVAITRAISALVWVITTEKQQAGVKRPTAGSENADVGSLKESRPVVDRQ